MTAPRTAADRRAAADGPGRATPPSTARAGILTIAVDCLNGCGRLATGTTTEPPTNRRYESRWAEMDALADRHVKDTGHPTRQGAGPSEVAR